MTDKQNKVSILKTFFGKLLIIGGIFGVIMLLFTFAKSIYTDMKPPTKEDCLSATNYFIQKNKIVKYDIEKSICYTIDKENNLSINIYNKRIDLNYAIEASNEIQQQLDIYNDVMGSGSINNKGLIQLP